MNPQDEGHVALTFPIYCEGAFLTTCVMPRLRLSTFSACSSNDIRNSLSLFFVCTTKEFYALRLSTPPVPLTPLQQRKTSHSANRGPLHFSQGDTTLVILTRLPELFKLTIFRLRAPETRPHNRPVARR
jgi:hypothetical protein